MRTVYTMDEVYSIFSKISAVISAPKTDEEYMTMLNTQEAQQEGLADALDSCCSSADNMHYNQADTDVQLVLGHFA